MKNLLHEFAEHCVGLKLHYVLIAFVVEWVVIGIGFVALQQIPKEFEPLKIIGLVFLGSYLLCNSIYEHEIKDTKLYPGMLGHYSVWIALFPIVFLIWAFTSALDRILSPAQNGEGQI